MIPSFQTDRPGKTMQTQIRLLIEEQFDQGLHCLQLCLHLLDALLYSKATLFKFQSYYSKCSGVWIFRIFTVVSDFAIFTFRDFDNSSNLHVGITDSNGMGSSVNEQPHDKTNKMTVGPAMIQISLGIRPVWSESSLSTWRKLGSLATHWAHSEDSDQTGRIPRLICVFAGRTVILLVLTWGGSNCNYWHLYTVKIWKIGTLKYSSHLSPLTFEVVGAPQMTLQQYLSIFPCLPLPAGNLQTPFPSIPFPSLPLSSSPSCSNIKTAFITEWFSKQSDQIRFRPNT